MNDDETAEGLPDLLAESGERPWLMNPQAEWDAGRKLLTVTAETERGDPGLESEEVFDEI